MDVLCLIIGGCLAYAQVYYLRRDLSTLLLIICAQTVLLNQPVQAYLIPSLQGFVLSLLLAAALTVGLEKGA